MKAYRGREGQFYRINSALKKDLIIFGFYSLEKFLVNYNRCFNIE
jgi:hypothetical protein